MTTHSYRDAVAHWFQAWPNIWWDGQTLAQHGGIYGWRTRVSECRRELHMHIENRVRWEARNGRKFKVSEYRYIPAVDVREVAWRWMSERWPDR